MDDKTLLHSIINSKVLLALVLCGVFIISTNHISKLAKAHGLTPDKTDANKQ